MYKERVKKDFVEFKRKWILLRDLRNKQFCRYSKTSDSGHSEIGTQYNKPLNKGHSSRPQIISFPVILINF